MDENDKLLIAELKRDEGVVNHAYQDSKGYWTIGVGRLIDKRMGGRLTNDEIEYLLANDIDEKVKDLDRVAPWWRQLSLVRQRVMVNLTFNMGIGWIGKFKNTVANIRAGNFDAAARGMLQSKWARDVGPNRSGRLAEMMRKG